MTYRPSTVRISEKFFDPIRKILLWSDQTLKGVGEYAPIQISDDIYRRGEREFIQPLLPAPEVGAESVVCLIPGSVDVSSTFNVKDPDPLVSLIITGKLRTIHDGSVFTHHVAIRVRFNLRSQNSTNAYVNYL